MTFVNGFQGDKKQLFTIEFTTDFRLMKRYNRFFKAAFLMLLFLRTDALGQEKLSSLSLDSGQKILISLGDSILSGSHDSIRIQANEQFNSTLKYLLDTRLSYSYGFDSLKSVSILRSKDGLVKLYTWILPSMDKSSYSYFGFLQISNKKSDQITLFPLAEVPYENQEATYKICKPEGWYGALYYKMLETKTKGQTIYTLLGWHGKGRKTNRKVIEILTIKNGEPVFGMPIIKAEGKPACRIIFEFTSQAVMKLNYDERKKMIVFDHLSPAQGASKGQYEFYGPDFRYDALKFKKGFWVLQKDIDLRNPRSYDQKDSKKEKGKSFYDSGK